MRFSGSTPAASTIDIYFRIKYLRNFIDCTRVVYVRSKEK
jgi:hypothetical protein